MLLPSAVSESLHELLSVIAYRLGTKNEQANVNLLVRSQAFVLYAHLWFTRITFKYLTSIFFQKYDDDEGDKVLLATDNDLIAAIEHARSAGWKVNFPPPFSRSVT
jgi:hypothetical protein